MVPAGGILQPQPGRLQQGAAPLHLNSGGTALPGPNPGSSVPGQPPQQVLRGTAPQQLYGAASLQQVLPAQLRQPQLWEMSQQPQQVQKWAGGGPSEVVEQVARPKTAPGHIVTTAQPQQSGRPKQELPQTPHFAPALANVQNVPQTAWAQSLWPQGQFAPVARGPPQQPATSENQDWQSLT